ncbi:sulfatase family protein [Tichowtungia aerotolerans]|uniref:Sulfatase-like hydrolase/transferase n=1 Tax=Tichowtungia aerotolerans TaxID=2697043 RepID=A0A6P1MCD8_9BACT|nr:sulfatase [Tichowtungia aerotolerans]QHI70773.1 sulfatase-like hydrolase/transferase [Tichowtungia aerotolerans]
MKRIHFFWTVVVFVAVFSFNVRAEKRPNIIFLLTDDQRWDTLGCNGNDVIQTPHVDSLASGGVNFRNTFATTPICVISRASILTGQYMRSHGIRDFNKPFTPEQMSMTYPSILRRHGYFTGFTGKWGVGAEQFNYDLYKDEFDFWRGQPDQDLYWKDGKDGTHQNVRMSDDADDFMALAKKSGKPFCLSISFKAPHGPWHEYEPEIFATIDQSKMPIPETFTKEAWDLQPDFIKTSIGANEASPARDFRFNKKTNEHHQHLIAQYYALIEGVDASVGRILDSLKKYGLDDNTVLIYTADNGYLIHDKGLIGKWLLYEQSLRLPMVIYDPRLPAEARGKVRTEDVLNVDVAPTILSLAGVNIPRQMDGRDLTPLLRGEHPEWPQENFFEHTYSESGRRTIPKSVGVRSDEWKYIRYISENPPYEQLFNLKKDPQELNNLANSPEWKTVLESLRKQCDSFRRSIKDNYPDYEEYQQEYIVKRTGAIKANNPVQFNNVQSLGQTFPAETGFLTCCELMMPTWGKGEGPCDVTAELLQNDQVLGEVTIKKEDIENTRVQRLMFETRVKKGKEIYLRLTPAGAVPAQHMAWWAYDKPLYSEGTAFVNDQPQSYSHELRMVFKK